jgi:hypothetical protein
MKRKKRSSEGKVEDDTNDNNDNDSESEVDDEDEVDMEVEEKEEAALQGECFGYIDETGNVCMYGCLAVLCCIGYSRYLGCLCSS